MLHPHKHGSQETIQGITCYIPSVPNKQEIQGFYLAEKNQKWKRTPLPDFRVKDIDWFSGDDFNRHPNDIIDWETAVREETIKQTGCDPLDLTSKGPRKMEGITPDPYYVSPPLEKFRSQELHRIFNGHWFYNNGTPIYITGAYYFYLNWWKLDTGEYPEFRDPDRQLFYLWQWVKEHPYVLGLIYITMRGVGKSFIGGCLNYLDAITHRYAVTGIQSKTDDDARKVFRNKILTPITSLPEFLIPIHRHVGDLTQFNYLDFSPPNRKGMEARVYQKLKKDALRSYMGYANAGEYAYDGETLKFLLQDEIGKTSSSRVANVATRLQVNLDCVWRGDKKRGNIFATTTVEKMEEGGKECKYIWESSNPAEMLEDGRTKSGLIRYFVSALDVTFFDEYGYPLREKAKKFHDAKLKALEGDTNAYVGYMQKHPFTIEQAFMTMGTHCSYNRQILNFRQMSLKQPGVRVVDIGDFEWVEKDVRVKWVPNKENGKWHVSWLIPDPRDANNISFTIDIDGKKKFKPKNDGKFCAGVDPVSHRQVADPTQASKCAAAIKMKSNSWVEDFYSNTFVADYLNRDYNPENDYENILKAAFYYGCSVLIESNKSNIIDYFINRGYEDFLMVRPESTMGGKDQRYSRTYGIPSGPSTIEHYVDSTSRHITKYGYKEKHLRLIESWLDFDPTNTQKFDSAVAGSIAIVAEEKRVDEDRTSINLSEIMGSWDNSGLASKPNYL